MHKQSAPEGALFFLDQKQDIRYRGKIQAAAWNQQWFHQLAGRKPIYK